jgi:hypothetical protein
MPAYPKPVSSATIIATTVRRVKQLEAQLATRTVAGYTAGTYAANSISNPAVETDLAGWLVTLWRGAGQGSLTVNTATPLAGGQSLRVNEQASSASILGWCPGGDPANPVIGQDVFATVEGDQWFVSATMRANTDPAGNSVLYAVYGVTPASCYQSNYADQQYVAGTAASLPAGQPQTLTGLTTCPSDRFYVTFAASADDGGGPPTAWSWDIDGMSLQKKL